MRAVRDRVDGTLPIQLIDMVRNLPVVGLEAPICGAFAQHKHLMIDVWLKAKKALLKAFLNDDRFLITWPNVYNVLGIGATQLYNQTVVYDHKRLRFRSLTLATMLTPL